jgi:hypothetical protein
VREEGAVTLGCAALMTEEQLQRLDVFEGFNAEAPERGVYRREPVRISIRVSPGDCVSERVSERVSEGVSEGGSERVSEGVDEEGFQVVQGIAYIANNCEWKFPPSEQYLTAIHVMLREQWLQPGGSIDIPVRAVLPHSHTHSHTHSHSHSSSSSPLLLYTWQYPGRQCLSLPSLCVEVNLLRDEPWVMPRTIKEITAKLAAVGVHSAAQLAVCVGTPELREELNMRLESAGQSGFMDNTLLLFKEVMGV